MGCWWLGQWPRGAAHILLGRDDHFAHHEIKGEFTLAEQSDDIFYICGTTNSNSACAWRHEKWTGLLCWGKYQCKFMEAPRSSPIVASVNTKIEHVARFVRQCTNHEQAYPFGSSWKSLQWLFKHVGLVQNLSYSIFPRIYWHFSWKSRCISNVEQSPTKNFFFVQYCFSTQPWKTQYPQHVKKP